MLNGIHLVDFGNHRDTRLTFGRMTALVGQNGAGKTGVLRGVLNAHHMLLDSFAGFLGVKDKAASYQPNQRFVRKGAKKFILSTSWQDTLRSAPDKSARGYWGLRFDSGRSHQWYWHTNLHDSESDWMLHPKDNSKIPSGIKLLSSRNEEPEWQIPSQLVDGGTIRSDVPMLTHWRASYFKTTSSYLQNPSYSESVPPVLSEDCRDLAWVVSYLKGDKDEVFSEITSAMREVVPIFRRVRHRPVAVQRAEKKSVSINEQQHLFDEERQVMGQELSFDMASGEDLPASAISEGTLVTLAVLTAIMQNDDLKGSQTILLDDIESGLHPRAQRDLIRQLRKLQETRPELQIIFSSHSPYIIDELEPKDVWIFAADDEGIAHSKRLSDHPDTERAMQVLTTGEFWGAEGDAWVLDPAEADQPEAEPSTVG